MKALSGSLHLFSSCLMQGSFKPLIFFIKFYQSQTRLFMFSNLTYQLRSASFMFISMLDNILISLDTRGLNMQNKTAQRLEENIDKILSIWEERVNEEVAAAHHQETIALRNSLPEYLMQLVDALSNTIDRTTARKIRDKIDSTRIGKKHGEDRAGSRNYTMDQLITEYHILRQVLCDVLEEEGPLGELEREVIVCSIEQAVNDAATEYSDHLKSLKETMSNTLTHDLRNPLTSTKISAQLVLRKLNTDDSSVPKMNLIISNMDRLDQMITGILDASRLEAGQSMPIDREFCDLDVIIRQVTDELNLSYPDIFKVQSEGKCCGYWDEDGLRRLIENLVTNAVKYGEINKSITISLSQNRTSVELSVHNFGKPIPSGEVPILFEQYRRLKSATDKSGWGLGLTMVKGMVDAHNGSINVESEKNKGTTFIVKLPKDARTSLENKETQSEEEANQVEQVPQVPKSENPLARH
jgi:signal transduction histidine kinase